MQLLSVIVENRTCLPQKVSYNPLLNSDDIAQCVHALADEIIRKHRQLSRVVFMGVLSRGFPLAGRIRNVIFAKTGISIPVGKLDVGLYRDDLLTRGPYLTLKETEIPVDLNKRKVILVDDVLFNGRTIRAALNGILDFGRPSQIEVAVLIDRGHRKVPINATYVGRRVKTRLREHVEVKLFEVDGEDGVYLKGDVG